jgi:hypothetical protein
MLPRIGVMRALNRHVERGLQSGSEGQSLGTAQAGAGSMICHEIFGTPVAHLFRCLGIAATSETSYDAQLARRTVPPDRKCVGPL